MTLPIASIGELTFVILLPTIIPGINPAITALNNSLVCEMGGSPDTTPIAPDIAMIPMIPMGVLTCSGMGFFISHSFSS